LLGHPSALGNIKLIVCLDELTEELRMQAQKHNVEIVRFAEVEKEGKNSRLPPNPPGEDTLATICYTSGVTGILAV
jgi:long-subunit acyl-CoA synthetase (AMP-forming)